MRNHAIVTLLGVSTLWVGCAVEDRPGELGTAQQDVLTPEKDAFVHLHVVSGSYCAFNEVMIGFHNTQHKVICAQLNFGYKVMNSLVDYHSYYGSPGPDTQVSFGPAMHGCPENYFIQAIDVFGDGEDLHCVALETANNLALSYGVKIHDGPGPDDNGTQSQQEYSLTPNMHACPENTAMAGLHVFQNDLFCGG